MTENHATPEVAQVSVIKEIDAESVKFIAAGQKISNIQTIIRELVENSIDAEATVIEVRLDKFGAQCIEVEDNGVGIEQSNFETLGRRYHTSKISCFTKLQESLETYGFRGEALSCLCNVAHVTIITKAATSPTGTKLVFQNGRLIKSEPIARSVGTTVIVKQLFHSMPVRKRELENSAKRHYDKIVKLLYEQILARPHIKFSLYKKFAAKKQQDFAHGSSSLENCIITIFGIKVLESLIPIKQVEFIKALEDKLSKKPSSTESKEDIDEPLTEPKLPEQAIAPCREFFRRSRKSKFHRDTQPLYTIYGYISKVGCGRNSGDCQFTYVNKKACEIPKVTKLINELYKNYCNQYPFYCLFIQVQTWAADFNVPDKRLVILQNEDKLCSIIKDALERMFSPSAPAKLKSCPNANIPIASQKPYPALETSVTPIQSCSSEDQNTEAAESNQIADKPIQTIESSSPEKLLHSTKEPASSEKVPQSTLELNTVVESTSKETSKHSLERASTPTKELVPIRETCEKATESPSVQELSTTRAISCSLTEGSMQTANSRQNSEISPSISSKSYFITDVHMRPSKSLKTVEMPTETIECSLIEVIPSATPDSDYATPKPGSPDLMEALDQGTKRELEPNENDDEDIQLIKRFMSFQKSAYLQNHSEDMVVDFTSQEADVNSLQCVPFIDYNEYDVDCNYKQIKSVRNGKLQVKIEHPEELGSVLKRERAQRQTPKDAKEFSYAIHPKFNTVAEQELKLNLNKSSFESMRIIGQFNKGFIITRLNKHIFIIDQHATDERANYEDQLDKSPLVRQSMVYPKPLYLNSIQENVIMNNIDIFKAKGFDFTIDMSKMAGFRVMLSATSVCKGQGIEGYLDKEDIEELIDVISESPNCLPTYCLKKVKHIAATRACRKSVMIGEQLTWAKMTEIVSKMSTLENPWICAHNRPTIRHLMDTDW